LSLEVARLTHTSQILAAAASPDGRYMLVGDDVGNTILWDLAENTTVALPTRPGRKPISAVAFNQTGALCSSGGNDGDVIVWDVRSRQVLLVIP
jgi:WD40 repeat protein